MNDKLFSLRFKTSDGRKVSIVVTESDKQRSSSHTRLDIEVKVDRKVLFPAGQLYVGIPGHKAINGNFAKENVLACLALKPGDTDAESFADYSEAQLAFVNANSDMLCMKSENYPEIPTRHR